MVSYGTASRNLSANDPERWGDINHISNCQVSESSILSTHMRNSSTTILWKPDRQLSTNQIWRKSRATATMQQSCVQILCKITEQTNYVYCREKALCGLSQNGPFSPQAVDLKLDELLCEDNDFVWANQPGKWKRQKNKSNLFHIWHGKNKIVPFI